MFSFPTNLPIFTTFKDDGEIYVTKNCVTLHNYNDPQNPTYRGVPKNQDVKVLDQETKWWKETGRLFLVTQVFTVLYTGLWCDAESNIMLYTA